MGQESAIYINMNEGVLQDAVEESPKMTLSRVAHNRQYISQHRQHIWHMGLCLQLEYFLHNFHYSRF